MIKYMNKRTRKPRAKKEFDRRVNPHLSVEDKLKVFANLIVDRLIEEQGIGHDYRT